jgi:hypothetical protein
MEGLRADEARLAFRVVGARLNYAGGLLALKRHDEAKSLLLENIPIAARALGDANNTTLRLRNMYAIALYTSPDAQQHELDEAVSVLEGAIQNIKRIYGTTHPLYLNFTDCLGKARAKASRQGA